jgi:hypothetical protein
VVDACHPITVTHPLKYYDNDVFSNAWQRRTGQVTQVFGAEAWGKNSHPDTKRLI